MTSPTPSLTAAHATAAAASASVAAAAGRRAADFAGDHAAFFPRAAGGRLRPLVLAPKEVGICWKHSTIVNAGMSKAEASGSADKEAVPVEQNSSILAPEAITEFMNQVASLAKLVDSQDIVELQLKQQDCELIIRKKEALPQPPAPVPVVMMQQPPAAPSSAVLPSAAPSAPSPTTRPAALPPPPAAPKAPKSSHPPLESPMSGTFYRSPGPGQPPFVKVGDKVKKGQVLCIIEAMKLMNEIEADNGGTVVDILVDDGKPVGVGQPIFVIEP